MKKFSLGAILAVMTEIMAVEDIGEIYDLLNYMTNDNLSTVQLIRAGAEAKPYLIDQFPQFRHITADKIEGPGCLEKVATYAKVYGEMHSVRPMHAEDHEKLSDIEDLNRLGVDESKIFQVEIPDEPCDIGDINWKVE